MVNALSFYKSKMFCASPNFLSQPKNLTAFSASSKTFVPAQKPILSGTKCFWLPQYVNKFLVWHKKFGPAQNILGPVKGQGIRFPFICVGQSILCQIMSVEKSVWKGLWHCSVVYVNRNIRHLAQAKVSRVIKFSKSFYLLAKPKSRFSQKMNWRIWFVCCEE